MTKLLACCLLVSSVCAAACASVPQSIADNEAIFAPSGLGRTAMEEAALAASASRLIRPPSPVGAIPIPPAPEGGAQIVPMEPADPAREPRSAPLTPR